MTLAELEETDRNKQREIVAAGGWTIIWGDLINEWDAIQLTVSISTATVGSWASQQIEAQLQKFQQSIADVSDDVVNQATEYLGDLVKYGRSGERDINGLGVKAGIVTYHRKSKTPLGSTKLPNNYQPYIGLRVTKPLPPKGAAEMEKIEPLSKFEPVYNQGEPGNGIGGYDLKSTADQAFAFDYNHSGKTDHLVLFRPGTGTIWILKNKSSVFEPVYQQGDPGNGIGGYDLKSSADQAFAFDYNHSGKLDHIALYRPGTGTIWILQNKDGVFHPVYNQGDPGHGIGGYDLKSKADRAFAFDYDHSGKLDHLALYRPGTGTFWILQNKDGAFHPVYNQGDPGNGIGGYDLKSSADQAFAFDYDHSGKIDHIVLYRPGTGTLWILKNKDGSFHPVYNQGDPGKGIGGYDLKSRADLAFAFDYDHSGKLDHLALYRPGTGTIWILQNKNSVFHPVYNQGDPGHGIGGYDLKSSADRAFTFDYDHIGKLDHLVLYRPGTGTIWILRH
ncbi:hypothetical protein N7540_005347 [Penicillium herquei]|nr:hypothetical protein N7540_005347 [Penicillium herquei]